MKITFRDESFEWPTIADFRDGFTLGEEGEAERWDGRPWEAIWSGFWVGSRRSARVFLYILNKRLDPEFKWDDLDTVTDADWGFTIAEADVAAPEEPADPTSAPEGAAPSEISDSGTSTGS